MKIITKGKWNDSPSLLCRDLGVPKHAKIYQLVVKKIMHRVVQKHPLF